MDIGRIERKYIAGLAIGAFLLFSIGYGAVLHSQGWRNLEIQGVNLSKSEGSTGYDTMKLELTNQEDEPLEPVFRIIHQGSASYLKWRTLEGPEKLEPGETAEYVLKAEKRFSPLNPGTRYAIVVSGSHESWWHESGVREAPDRNGRGL